MQQPQALADALADMLGVFYDCSADTTLGQPPARFVYHGRLPPPDDCGHALVVWWERMRPTRKFPLADDTTAQVCGQWSRFVDVKVRLLRDCWPVVADDALNPFPAAEAMQEAADHLHVDAEVLWCCATQLTGNGVLDGEVANVQAVAIDEMIADPPRGGVASNTLSLKVELEPCC